MPNKVKRYRRRVDGALVEAIQYGKTGRSVPNGVSDVAKFVLRMDVDSHVTVANERILDVVIPDMTHWSHDGAVANIYIADSPRQPLPVTLGDWIVRDLNDDSLEITTPIAFAQDYEEVVPETPPTEYDDLVEVIQGVFGPLSGGEIYQQMAKSIAEEVIRAGWSRKAPN